MAWLALPAESIVRTSTRYLPCFATPGNTNFQLTLVAGAVVAVYDARE